jgi:hypothetical protein
MLGGQIYLADKIKIKFPAMIEPKLSKPRNSETPEYACLDRKIAIDEFELAGEIFRAHAPLAPKVSVHFA